MCSKLLNTEIVLISPPNELLSFHKFCYEQIIVSIYENQRLHHPWRIGCCAFRIYLNERRWFCRPEHVQRGGTF